MTCPYGTYYIALASSGLDCGECPLGTASPSINATSSATCEACPIGFATTAPASASCVACGAGFYAPTLGTPFCLACPGDAYGATSGANTCTPCPQYTVSASVAATSASACVDNSTIGCPPGAAPGPGTSCSPVRGSRIRSSCNPSHLPHTKRSHPRAPPFPPAFCSAALERTRRARGPSRARPAESDTGATPLALKIRRRACHSTAARALTGPIPCVGGVARGRLGSRSPINNTGEEGKGGPTEPAQRDD